MIEREHDELEPRAHDRPWRIVLVVQRAGGAQDTRRVRCFDVGAEHDRKSPVCTLSEVRRERRTQRPIGVRRVVAAGADHDARCRPEVAKPCERVAAVAVCPQCPAALDGGSGAVLADARRGADKHVDARRELGAPLCGLAQLAHRDERARADSGPSVTAERPNLEIARHGLVAGDRGELQSQSDVLRDWRHF